MLLFRWTQTLLCQLVFRMVPVTSIVYTLFVWSSSFFLDEALFLFLDQHKLFCVVPVAWVTVFLFGDTSRIWILLLGTINHDARSMHACSYVDFSQCPTYPVYIINSFLIDTGSKGNLSVTWRQLLLKWTCIYLRLKLLSLVLKL